MALLVVSMVLASFNRLDPSLSKLTATAPFVVFTAALLVLKGELLNGDMEVGILTCYDGSTGAYHSFLCPNY